MTNDTEYISSVIRDLEREQENIHAEIRDICFWMKGGITWNEAWALSHLDRSKIINTIEKNIKAMTGDKTEYM
jgi:hypothetical protein